AVSPLSPPARTRKQGRLTRLRMPNRQTEPGTAPNSNAVIRSLSRRRPRRPAETPGGHEKANAPSQVALIAAGCTRAVGLFGMVIICLLRRAPLRLSVQVS